MAITGSFTTKHNKTCNLSFENANTENGEITSKVIGSEGLFFQGKTPIKITYEDDDDTFGPIIKSKCAVKLLSENYLPDLFTGLDRDKTVNITVSPEQQEEAETLYTFNEDHKHYTWDERSEAISNCKNVQDNGGYDWLTTDWNYDGTTAWYELVIKTYNTWPSGSAAQWAKLLDDSGHDISLKEGDRITFNLTQLDSTTVYFVNVTEINSRGVIWDFNSLYQSSTEGENTFKLTTDIDNLYILADGAAYITEINIIREPDTEELTYFSGYVTPNSYQMPYAKKLTSFTVNCQDFLSTLENHIYREDDIYDNGYSAVKQSADTVTFAKILENIGITEYTVLPASEASRFTSLSISEILLLGDEEDDVWSAEDCLAEILRYLDLHAIIIGGKLYFFSWTYKQNIDERTLVNFSDYVSGSDTKLSFADVYNQLKITCDVKDEDTVISSPFDEDSLSSPFTNKQHYCDTYMSWGEGGDSQGAFKNIIKEQNSNYDAWAKKSYFLQVYKSSIWQFNTDDFIDTLNKAKQWKVPQYLHDNRFKCAMFSVGSIDNHLAGADNNEVTNIGMENYIYISVNGEADQSYTYYPWYGTSAIWGTGYVSYNQPNKAPSKDDIDTFISGGGWLAKYNGNTNGGALGATDNSATNYLVFSGKIILKPKYHITPSLTTGDAWFGEDTTIYDTLYKFMADGQKFKGASGTNGFYTVKFYDNSTPSSTDTVRDPSTDLAGANLQFYNSDFTFDNDDGYADDVYGLTKYKGDHEDNEDVITKVPILQCELTIGDYFVMETELGKYKWYKDKGDGTYLVWNGATWGTTSSKPYNFLSDTANGYYNYEHIFSLGFNPAVGDRVFAKEYDFANNVSYLMNLDDAEGIALALPTGISGKVSFKIIAPVAATWTGEVCTRQPSTWHHSSWDDRTCEILPFTESIIIKDLECKLYTNNANVNNYNEQDLIYFTTKTKEAGTFGIKDDITFKFSTALTTNEALAAGQSPGAKLSNVINTNEQTPFTGFSGEKQEANYLNYYYNEYYKPRLIIESSLSLDPISGYWDILKIEDPSGNFYPTLMEIDIKDDKTKFTLREQWK